MYQRQLFVILLRPSPFSTVSTMVCGILLFGVTGWAYISKSPMFYDYFFGPVGIATSLDKAAAGFYSDISTLLSQSWMYNVVILLGSLLVGLLVYLTLQTVTKVMFTVSETIQEAQEGDQAARKALKKEIITRSTVRIGVALSWLIYIMATFSYIIPFCISVFKTGIISFPLMESWLYILIAAALFFVSIHLHVICARLLFLRPRIFGGEYLIMEALN